MKRGLTLLVAVVSLTGAARVAAQVPDTLPPDSLPADSLPADTVDATARYLEAQREGAVRVELVPLLGSAGPRPARSRIVLDRDSLDWSGAQTLGELLSRVPGVYLWRGGWIGRHERPNYEGRGAASVEYVLDGMPYFPIGPDSTGVDPTLISPGLLERIEIERWPGLLRVHLFTRRHGRLAARSRIGLSTGSRDLTRYEASLERHFASGLGFGLGADYVDSPDPFGPPVLTTDSAGGGAYSNTNVWVQGGYVPSARYGAQFQLVRSGPDRDPTLIRTGPDSLDTGVEGTRSDMQLRAFWRAREDGFGFGADVIYGRTGWTDATLDQRITQYGAIATYRAPAFSASASAFTYTRWTSIDLRASANWAPLTSLTLNAEVAHQSHYADRASDWVGLRAGLALPAGFGASASGRFGDIVATPSVGTSLAQPIRDLRGALSWDRSWFGAEVAYSRTAEFTPQPFQPFRGTASLGTVPQTNWLTASGHVQPFNWLLLEGWYSDPTAATVVGMPPSHAVGRGTIRSSFLRTFPSGAFDLQLQLSGERWGPGVIGLTAAGTPIATPSVSFVRSHVQLRLVGFMLYWERVNLMTQRSGYVPGFRIPAFSDVFGVRWDFLN